MTWRKGVWSTTLATAPPHHNNKFRCGNLSLKRRRLRADFFADFFDLAGVHYLLTVDRLSGWINVMRAAPGTTGSGAKGFIARLRLLFANKGIPKKISSERETEFTAGETQQFLKDWHVIHRLCSVHFTDAS